MKRTFIRFEFAPKQTGGGKTEIPAPAPVVNDKPEQDAPAPAPEVPAPEATEPKAPEVPKTPEQLIEDFKAERATKWAALKEIEDSSSKEFVDGQLEIFKIGSKIKEQEAKIEQAKKEAELQVKRNGRVQLQKDLEAAIRAEVEHRINVFDKSEKTQSDIDAMNALTDVTKAAREIVVNELLAKYATSTPSKPATEGSSTTPSTGGKIQAEIKEKLLALIGGGKTPTEAVKSLIDEGYSRGTAGAVRTQMVKDGEITG